MVFGRSHVSTDNAQVDGHIVPVLPKVGGYVAEVRVVRIVGEAGDTLVCSMTATTVRASRRPTRTARAARYGEQSHAPSRQADAAVPRRRRRPQGDRRSGAHRAARNQNV